MQWRQIIIDGVEYDYEVSNEGGHVRNSKTGNILKAQKNGDGYFQVVLCKDGKVKCFRIHRLVATVWIPNPHNYETVDHIDHNRQNNDVSNLRWLPRSENCSNNSHAKKVYCYELDQTFDSIREAEQETGVINISKACQGKYKTAGGYHWEYVD